VRALIEWPEYDQAGASAGAFLMYSSALARTSGFSSFRWEMAAGTEKGVFLSLSKLLGRSVHTSASRFRLVSPSSHTLQRFKVPRVGLSPTEIPNMLRGRTFPAAQVIHGVL
jgi:hypothetical protein